MWQKEKFSEESLYYRLLKELESRDDIVVVNSINSYPLEMPAHYYRRDHFCRGVPIRAFLGEIIVKAEEQTLKELINTLQTLPEKPLLQDKHNVILSYLIGINKAIPKHQNEGPFPEYVAIKEIPSNLQERKQEFIKSIRIT